MWIVVMQRCVLNTCTTSCVQKLGLAGTLFGLPLAVSRRPFPKPRDVFESRRSLGLPFPMAEPDALRCLLYFGTSPKIVLERGLCRVFSRVVTGNAIWAFEGLSGFGGVSSALDDSA